METAAPIVQGWKQWSVVALATASWLAVSAQLFAQASVGPLELVARLLVDSMFVIAVLVPQAILVIVGAYLVAKPPFLIVATLVLLTVLTNLALGAALGAGALLLGPPSFWVGVMFFVLCGAGLFIVARGLWGLPAKLAAVTAATFAVFKLLQQVLLPQLWSTLR